jgi:hypothetical protein
MGALAGPAKLATACNKMMCAGDGTTLTRTYIQLSLKKVPQ